MWLILFEKFLESFAIPVSGPACRECPASAGWGCSWPRPASGECSASCSGDWARWWPGRRRPRPGPSRRGGSGPAAAEWARWRGSPGMRRRWCHIRHQGSVGTFRIREEDHFTLDKSLKLFIWFPSKNSGVEKSRLLRDWLGDGLGPWIESIIQTSLCKLRRAVENMERTWFCDSRHHQRTVVIC